MKGAPFLAVVTTLLAVAVYVLPGAQDFCVFDREAILRGEWRRVFTAHAVHFSRSHFWLNAAVFLVAGGIVESRSRRVFVALLLLASAAISGAVFVLSPEMRFYGGLSGIATAMLFFVALQFTEEKGFVRGLGILVIAAALMKVMWEGLHPQPLFAHFDSATMRSAPIAHAAGIAVAAAIWFSTRSPCRVSRFSFSRAQPL